MIAESHLRVFCGYSVGILWVLLDAYLGDGSKGYSIEDSLTFREGEVNCYSGLIY